MVVRCCSPENMISRYLSTSLATNWTVDPGNGHSLPQWILGRVLSFLPKANPTYEEKFPQVKSWLIEFEDGHLPAREIGLDAEGRPILHGPTGVDYGFWLDTDMTYDDFEGSPISKEQFENFWEKAERGVSE